MHPRSGTHPGSYTAAYGSYADPPAPAVAGPPMTVSPPTAYYYYAPAPYINTAAWTSLFDRRGREPEGPGGQ